VVRAGEFSQLGNTDYREFPTVMEYLQFCLSTNSTRSRGKSAMSAYTGYCDTYTKVTLVDGDYDAIQAR